MLLDRRGRDFVCKTMTMKNLSPSKIPSNGPRFRVPVAIVDDDENELSLMTRAVDQAPDLRTVATYSSGAQALAGIPSSATEVVLMDVRMPGLSGNECARRLRNFRPNLVIIMISGFEHPDASAQAQEAGADAYLTKPFSLDRFLETLTACLHRRNLAVNETDRLKGFLFVQTKETSEPAPAGSPVPPSGTCHGSAVQHQSNSADPKQGPWIEDPTVVKALHRMISRMEENLQTRKDLLQEALVHFWLTERQSPGQQLGWYLRGVRFHLHHWKTSGRSLDSPKRLRTQTAFAGNCDSRDHWFDTSEHDDGIMSEINARDVLSLLLCRLTPIDQTILIALVDGEGVCDIAKKLNVSHVLVTRHRCRIARLAIKLGVTSVHAGVAAPQITSRV
jgi:DNA-binding NarL/FixJ family response regulator